MGFFDDVLNTVARVGTAIVTGGTSEIVRAIDPRLAVQAQALLFPTTPRQLLTTAALAAAPLTFGASSALGARAVAGQLPTTLFQQPSKLAYMPPATPTIGVQPMGLDIGGLLSGVGTLFSGSAFNTVGQVANVASQFFPAQQLMNVPMVVNSQAMQVSAQLPAVRGGSLTKEIFEAGTKLLGRLGIPFRPTAGAFSSALKRALGAIASLARRTPAGTIISILAGLGLTAYEATLLTAWHAQKKRHRRMNPANSKALRRAARRIKSFHKLCQVTDLIKTRSRSRSFARCGTCKKSPCRC